MSWKSKYDAQKNRIDKLEEELDIFNKKHRELKAKYKLALELIQKIDPTKKITQ